MLIKNEISFGGLTAHQNNALLVMITLYVFSLLGCALLVIILLKLLITCVFTDKFNQLFCLRSDHKVVTTGDDNRKNSVSDSSELSTDSLSKLSPKFYKLDDFIVKLSESQFESKKECICPICSNGHLAMAGIDDHYVKSEAKSQRKVNKQSSFISRRAHTLSQTLVLKKEFDFKDINDNKTDQTTKELARDVPILSKSEAIVLRKGERPLPHIKQIANYSDVVLELKEKFSSMTVINSIV